MENTEKDITREARVIRVEAKVCLVEADGERFLATPRGQLFDVLAGVKNPVAVGDRVRVSLHGDPVAIEEVLPRRNHLSRVASSHDPREQVEVDVEDDVRAVPTDVVGQREGGGDLTDGDRVGVRLDASQHRGRQQLDLAGALVQQVERGLQAHQCLLTRSGIDRHVTEQAHPGLGPGVRAWPGTPSAHPWAWVGPGPDFWVLAWPGIWYKYRF